MTYNLCRICLAKEPDTYSMQPLFFENGVACDDLVEKIEECGGIKLNPLQGVPSMLCPRCLDLLNAAYKFRELCQASVINFVDEEQTDPDGVIVYEIYKEDVLDEKQIEYDEIGAQNEDNDYVYQIAESTDSDYEPRKKQKQSTPKTKRIKRGRRSSPKKSNIKDGAQTKPPTVKHPKSIMCEVCGLICTTNSGLNVHMRRHRPERPFTCELCPKAFASPSELTCHMRVHTGERPYVCKYCHRKFSDRSSHIRHRRTHTNERPFECYTCNKTFAYASVLKRHLKTHTGEKPFSCVPCNKCFSRKDLLDQHISTVTHKATISNFASN